MIVRFGIHKCQKHEAGIYISVGGEDAEDGGERGREITFKENIL